MMKSSNSGGEAVNYVISIINPDDGGKYRRIVSDLSLPLTVSVLGRGTAPKNILDLLGIASREKLIVMSTADEEKTEALIKEERRRLYIDAPGNGVVLAVPVKSIGGGKLMAMLGAEKTEAPVFDNELILAIANEGHIDDVMDAARAAGARGGTVLHGKGTASSAKFFNVSIADEKEVIMIVAQSSQKAEIMKSIIRSAGPDTPARAIVFSLPVTSVGGFGIGNTE